MDQHDQSNEKTWDHETKNPSGYQVTPYSTFGQKSHETYPAAGSKSWIEPYTQREHAWNEDQHDQSNEKTWEHETKNPSGYQVTPYSSLAENLGGHVGETHSYIDKYNQREQAWNEGEREASNYYEYKKNVPKGYGGDKLESVDPMNKPFDEKKYAFYGRYANGTLYNYEGEYKPYYDYYANKDKAE